MPGPPQAFALASMASRLACLPEAHGAWRNQRARDNQKQGDGQRHSDGGNSDDSEKGRGAVLGNRRQELIVHFGLPPGGCAAASTARCSWAITSVTGRFVSRAIWRTLRRSRGSRGTTPIA